jgi:hypothetical protein
MTRHISTRDDSKEDEVTIAGRFNESNEKINT